MQKFISGWQCSWNKVSMCQGKNRVVLLFCESQNMSFPNEHGVNVNMWQPADKEWEDRPLPVPYQCHACSDLHTNGEEVRKGCCTAQCLRMRHYNDYNYFIVNQPIASFQIY